jgi:hypothetical protein
MEKTTIKYYDKTIDLSIDEADESPPEEDASVRYRYL